MPNICCTSVPESQISIHFHSQAAIFLLYAILRQVHRMTYNDLEHYKVKSSAKRVSNIPESQISLLFTLRLAIL